MYAIVHTVSDQNHESGKGKAKEEHPGRGSSMEGHDEPCKGPMYDLNGKVAVVTGSGQGLGKWMALGLAEAGADILAADIVANQAAQTAEEIRGRGSNADFIEVDVGDPAAVARMMEKADRELGSLDILVNNAGVNVHKKALDITPEDFDRVVRVNSRGVYLCCQAAARLMIPKKKGKMINIASAAGFLVRAGIPNSVYAMTKAGIIMVTKAFAEEWAQYNLNVNAIAPGYFATAFVADRLKDPQASKSILESTPLGRVGGPEDIVGLTVFLASRASDYITGQTIFLDGGRTIL
jgi:NAD(P)-dependent dehydrogenase (short-subunit alcohol dehydrogenase family)